MSASGTLSTTVPGETDDKELREPAPSPEMMFEARRELARHFVRGDGLEIGAAFADRRFRPKPASPYVDRMSADELRGEYLELADLITPVES